LSPGITHEIRWNRVVNVKGRLGGNIGIDLENEFLNKDFKGKPMAVDISITMQRTISFCLCNIAQ
jgi:hypothetical protein